MAKEELLTVNGSIDEILPNGRFGATLDNEHRIIAYTAGKIRRHRIRPVVDDHVHLEMTPYGPAKGWTNYARDTRPSARRCPAAYQQAQTRFQQRRQQIAARKDKDELYQ